MQRITIAETKRIGTRTVTFVLAFSVAAFVASGVSYAKPPAWAQLDAELCNGLSGVWTPGTCTIPEGTSAVVSSRLKIGDGITLDIKGSLTIPDRVTVANSGIIIVENAGGTVDVPSNDAGWKPGLLVFGALDNEGAITIENVVTGTEGITVSFSLGPPVPEFPSPFVVVPGTLTNSGTITIQNREQTRGIKNLGTIANSASGTITVANSATTSVGIYNRREYLGYTFYTNGTVTNAGSITISNSGNYSESSDPDPSAPPSPLNGYGIYNQGLFTNSAGGMFTINPGADVAVGLYNAGNFTSYGTFTNNRGDPSGSTWGSFNHTGTMINYGTTLVGSESSATGTFYNNKLGTMVNLGTITSYGLMHDVSYVGNMINYGTIYNYGRIDAGVNHGLCIDEPPDGSGC